MRKGMIKTLIAIFIRPWLWRSAFRFIPNLTYLSQSRSYIRFRMEEMYGDPNHEIIPKETIRFLYWCRKYNLSLIHI